MCLRLHCVQAVSVLQGSYCFLKILGCERKRLQRTAVEDAGRKRLQRTAVEDVGRKRLQ